MITIAITSAAFVVGALVSVIVLLRIGISREETDKSLTAVPSTRSAVAARRLVGLYVRSPQGASSGPDGLATRIRPGRTGPTADRPEI
jgi:hypothetical protein